MSAYACDRCEKIFHGQCPPDVHWPCPDCDGPLHIITHRKKEAYGGLPKKVAHDMIAQLTAFASNPVAMKLWADLESARNRAAATGNADLFDKLWAYEVERHKELPSPAPSPMDVVMRMERIA